MRRQSTSAFMDNLFKTMPVGRKLRLLVQNRVRAFQLDGCCGHPGEPGC